MRLLVLGGTVFLSRAVAEEAVRRGHDVTCACRGSRPLPPGVRHLALDRAADAGIPDSGTPGAGTPGAHPALIDEYDAVVDVARHPSRVRAAVAAVPNAAWVFVSTVNVYADLSRPGGPQDELVAPLEEDRDLEEDPEAYGAMKVACERIVAAGAASAMLVRPGLIVGPGDPSGRFSYWVDRLADDSPGEVLAPGSPEDRVQLLDVDDLATFLVSCAEQRATGALDAVGPVLTRGELLTEVARGVGTDPKLQWVDSERLVALEVQEWMGPRSLPLWVSSSEFAAVAARDPAPAARAGLVTRPVSQTADRTLAWLRSTPEAQRTGLTRAEEREVLSGRPLARPRR